MEASRATAFRQTLKVLGCAGLAVACNAAFAQVARLAPATPPVEILDPSERISGNAAVGIVLVEPTDTIGADRLWAYLSEPMAPSLKLRISSIDGRYYAEVDYTTGSLQPGWVALDLNLRAFSFLEDNYSSPLNEIAALLSDAEAPRFYPVRWGAAHAAVTKPPAALQNDSALRIYMNTERANAFVVVDGRPAYCRDASAMSGFKFNAICEVTLGAVRREESGGNVIDGFDVYRRSGVRTLAPVSLDVSIRY